MKHNILYRGVTFTVADNDTYPKWTGSSDFTMHTTDAPGGMRASVRTTVGVRYGKGALRRRVLRAARAITGEAIPDDASITFPVLLGADLRVEHVDDTATMREYPEIWYQVGGVMAYRSGQRATRPTLQRLLDGHTFGLNNEHLLESALDRSMDAEGVIHIVDDENQLEDLLERALRAMVEPPAKAPAFPSHWQDYVIQPRRPDYCDPYEFEHITDEAMDCMAALGLAPDKKTVQWDTYPATFGVNLHPRSLLDIIHGAQSEEADAHAAECEAFAEQVATYRRKLLTPKTLLCTVAPLYRDALACVDPEIRVTSRGSMQYAWEPSYDYDEAVEQHHATDAAVTEVIEGVMSDVEDAVDYLCGVFAKQHEDHYDYVNSDEGVWNNAEGCGDLGDEWISHVTQN